MKTGGNLFFRKRRPGIAFLLALSLVLAGIPIASGNINIVRATENVEDTYIINEDFDKYDQVWDASGEHWSLGWGLSIHWDRCLLEVKDGTDKWVRFDPIRSNESDVYALPLWMNVAEEKQYTLGDNADVSTDPYVVVEMDLAMIGANADQGSMNIRMGGDGYFAVTNFVLLGDRIARRIDSSLITSLREDGKNAYTPGTVGHLKYVLNRSTKQYSYFWNGVLVEQNVNAQFGGETETPALKHICFEANPITLNEGQTEADVQVYVDNVLMYGSGSDQMPTPTPAPTAEPTPEPTPAPTASPAPTAEPMEGNVIINTNFNEYAPELGVWNIGGDYWTGSWNLSVNYGYSRIVQNTDEDNRLMIQPAVRGEAYVYDSPVQFNIKEEKQLPLGSAVTEDRYLVFEADLAIEGEDELQGSASLWLAGNGYFAITDFELSATHIGRHISSSSVTGLREDGKNAYTQGETGSLKWVLDRETKTYSWFWNGELVEQNVNAQFGGEDETPALKYIYFDMPIQTASGDETTVDTRYYIDNVKLYACDDSQLPTPEPTAEPTPAPTYNPVSADIIFDNFELGHAYVRSLSGDYWTGGLDCGGWIAHGVVVAKNTVDPSAADDDYCYEFKPDHTQSLNFRFTLDESRAYSMGEAVDKERYVIVEMDVAIGGEAYKTNGYGIFFGPGSNLSTTQLRLFNDKLGRIHTGSSGGYLETAAYTAGEFAHLTWVLDRETKTYSYMLNGVVAERGVADLYGEATKFAELHIRVYADAPAEGEDYIDSRLYLDNVKIYGVDENPVPTPAPTAEPTPEPTATPEPTVEPTAEPTAEPNPGIGEELEIGIKTLDAEAPATITAPEGGWVEGDNTFTVACAKACFVAVSYDGGTTYTRLDATAVTEGYSFTAEDMTADTIIAVRYVGDVNGDGQITNADATQLAAIFSDKRDPADALSEIACDVNNDKSEKPTNADVTQLRAGFAGKRQLNW